MHPPPEDYIVVSNNNLSGEADCNSRDRSNHQCRESHVAGPRLINSHSSEKAHKEKANNQRPGAPSADNRYAASSPAIGQPKLPL